ncbi:MAG: ribonuclease P protein component [Candidatus Spechtbacterales bacterium]|nr:ribonuclease P protein component [Candidatus Spechtbacterales bacterium]
MIPKKNTLNTKEFTQVIKNGKNYKGKFFFIKVLKNKDKKTRIGVGVSKKLTKKAVLRNYYKRLLRHVIVEVLPTLDSDVDIVFIGQENIKSANFQELIKDANDIFKKANII